MRLLVQLEPPVGVADIGRDLILTESSTLIIGRCKSAADAISTNLLFNCRVVSRNHGILFIKYGNVFVQDTKSSSGTFVNGFRLSPPGIQSTPYQISEGDELRLGEDIKVSGGNGDLFQIVSRGLIS